MWEIKDGNLIQTIDETRFELEVRISKETLDFVEQIAEENNSFTNYVIENGLKNFLAVGEINYNKKKRPKDRVRYRSTFDEELVKSMREFAKDHRLYPGDVIESSIEYVDISKLPNQDHRYRIERGDGK